MIPEVLFLVKQIRPTTSQIDNLGTSIAILLETCTLKAVEGVRDALTATNDALILVIAERAFVADAGKGGRPDVGVTDGAFAVAFVAETADGNAGLLATHDEIAGQC
jgi:hypothetical protein